MKKTNAFEAGTLTRLDLNYAMAKYRKKPIVIEAHQWFPGERIDGVYTEAVARMPKEVQEGVEFGINEQYPRCAAIFTLEGWMLVTPGDWIITGIKGEKYPCKPDIFEATYDPA